MSPVFILLLAFAVMCVLAATFCWQGHVIEVKHTSVYRRDDMTLATTVAYKATFPTKRSDVDLSDLIDRLLSEFADYEGDMSAISTHMEEYITNGIEAEVKDLGGKIEYLEVNCSCSA